MTGDKYLARFQCLDRGVIPTRLASLLSSNPVVTISLMGLSVGGRRAVRDST